MKELAIQHPRYGYLMLHALLRYESLVINKKRTYRLYKEENLQVRTKKRKKLQRDIQAMELPRSPNQRWSMDFVSDQLANGRRFRVLNIVDDYSRELVGQLASVSITGKQVARFLDQTTERRTLPKSIVCGNGPEFTSKAMFFWSQKSKAQLAFIQPGKPTQNAFVESFNLVTMASSLDNRFCSLDVSMRRGLALSMRSCSNLRKLLVAVWIILAVVPFARFVQLCEEVVTLVNSSLDTSIISKKNFSVATYFSQIS